MSPLNIARVSAPVHSCWLLPTGMDRRTDARMGDKDAVEALSGTKCIEDGVVATLRGDSSDDPQVGGREAVGARPVGRGARYTARPAVGHKLDPHKGIIEARLEEYPRLSAKRLFEEVRAAIRAGMCG